MRGQVLGLGGQVLGLGLGLDPSGLGLGLGICGLDSKSESNQPFVDDGDDTGEEDDNVNDD